MAKRDPNVRARNQAVTAALAGDIATALPALLALHASGDAAASAGAAEILAFQGKWKEMAPCAKAVLANPDAVHTSNVLDDMKALLASMGKLPKRPKPEREQRKTFDDAIALAPTLKRLKNKPRELAHHCFALAVVFHVDDEIIARWDPEHPHMHFDDAAEVARALVRANKAARAWKILESRLSRWYPVDATQVLPVVLRTDPWLATLMTPARAKLVLRTPRAVH